ncbi:hypothetical protein IW150_000476 [Coemansia sp. RSA 2607]|nr:hypothetical protein IW150_000476 [Coemansia sp. RSA 2607]
MGDGRCAANTQSVVDNVLIDPQLKSRPVPTTAWWQNLVIDAGCDPIVPSPYTVCCLDTGIVVSSPTPHVQKKFVASICHNDWTLHMPGCSRHWVSSYDPLSVNVSYVQDGQASDAAVTVPLVRGSAFVSAIFNQPARLQLSTIHAVLSVDTSYGPGTAVVRLNSGSVWLVVCESSVDIRQELVNDIVSDEPVCGAVRLALVRNAECNSVTDENAAVLALLASRDAVPVGGSVSIDAIADDKAKFTMSWKTRGSGTPLMYTLPHHQMSSISQDSSDFRWVDEVATQWTSRGRMRAALSCQWQWIEQLEPLGFSGQTPLSEEAVVHLRQLVAIDAQSLTSDKQSLPQDPYFFGKALARAMRIALIADEVGDTDSCNLVVDRAIDWLEPWLYGTNSDHLVYDTEWCGVISSAGLADPMADFGQGRYNDHHFHYGYFVYAAAALAKLRFEWAAEKRDILDIFVRDYFNISADIDMHFPFIRCFDFFNGHSYTNGLFAFADSRNQESTSESINAYYAAYLYADVTGRPEIAQYAHAVLQLEARTSRTYWHLGDVTSDIYPDTYAQKQAVVGILWSTKADYTTWFGNNPEFIYGIQFLPYTPAMALLVKRKWIAEIWPQFLAAVADNSQTESWREIIHLTYAVVDKKQTLEWNSSITSHDDGNSASNSYYWIMTAPTED